METYQVVYVCLTTGTIMSEGPIYRDYDRAELECRYRNAETDNVSDYEWVIHEDYAI